MEIRTVERKIMTTGIVGIETVETQIAVIETMEMGIVALLINAISLTAFSVMRTI